MKIKMSNQGDIVIASLSGNVMGGPDYDRFHTEIKDRLEAGDRRFLFDFSQVKWINSTGLGIIVSASISIGAAEGRLAICGSNKRVEGIYYVTQLEKYFEHYPTVEAGLAALA